MPAVKKRLQSQKKKEDVHLKEIYFNAQHPASFGGIEKLKNAVPHLNPKTVSQWLGRQWTYALHKPIRRKFPYRKYMSKGVNEQWQADLVEMQPYSRENQGYRYILCVVDIFSRFAYARPLKSKSGIDVAEALESILLKVKPKYLQTDQGKEFYNNHVQSLLQKYNIQLFSVYSDKKAAIVERFQRTLQDRLYKVFTYQGNYKWLQVLPDLIDSYNNSYHRGIKTKPILVKKSNETDVWINQYSQVKEPGKVPKFKIGDVVRIPKHRGVFTKGYIEKWTDEEFTVTSINSKYYPHLYTLTDLNGQVIKGSFYEQELQLVDNPNKMYRIERVLKTRITNGVKEALVKWKGFDEPSWINYNNLILVSNA